MRKFVLWAAMAIVPMAAFASRLVLTDGSVINGTFVNGDSREIVFRDANGVQRRFSMNQVRTLDFENYGAANVGNDRGYRDSNSANRNEGNYGSYGTYPSGRLGSSSSATLPVGTEISVRTNENIDAQTATEGRTYAAQLDRDVTDSSGNVVIPRGADARLAVRNVTSGGTLGSGSLVLDLDSVSVNGRRYMVSTGDINQGGERGIGKNKRTAEMVGGGAVLGTLLGAVAGGGKGAAIGALAGAAAGGTAQVLTKGKEIKVPAETVLNFRLDQPLQLREVR